MKKSLTFCLAFATAAFSIAAFSAPGEYWEITSKTEMPGMPFAMPATTQKLCIGKGNEKEPRQSSKDKDCEMTDVKISGNKTSWKMRCNNNGEVMTGTGEQTTNADSYQGVVHFAGKSNGRDMNMTQNYSGKRLGGSCDTEELAKQVHKQIAQSCELSGHSTAELINMSDIYVGKGSMCADKREAFCSTVRKDAGSNADTYAALASHDKHLAGGVSVSKACGINMEATTRSICKTLNGKNFHTLSPYCPAEAKAFKEAERKAKAGRDYTGRDYTSEDAASGDAGSSKSGSSKSSTNNPADAAIEGAKKLKGLFGF